MLIINIGILGQVADENAPLKRAGAEMMNFPTIKNAFLRIENGKIFDFGEMKNCPQINDETIDAKGGLVIPTFSDSHTHIVYAKSREEEFVDKIKGLGYEEIAKKGGGILNSAAKLRETSEDVLFESAQARMYDMIRMGTGAMEIKSGYGLSLADELKMLRVVRRLKESAPITIKSTFLGAHAFPKDYSRTEYMDLLVNRMIPQVAEEGLADYCDVFCDRGFFTKEETDRILAQGVKYGLKPKIHANELDYSGGIQVGVKYGAVSVDHLECTGEEEIEVLLNSETMPTLLPGTAFFLRIEYPPARKMIDAGLPIAIASDHNPGSCPSGNMSFALSLSCIQMRMMPEEAFNAATINAAYAMELSQTHGIIQIGREANVLITKPVPSLAFLPYSFGSNLIDKVILKGKVF